MSILIQIFHQLLPSNLTCILFINFVKESLNFQILLIQFHEYFRVYKPTRLNSGKCMLQLRHCLLKNFNRLNFINNILIIHRLQSRKVRFKSQVKHGGNVNTMEVFSLWDAFLNIHSSWEMFSKSTCSNKIDHSFPKKFGKNVINGIRILYDEREFTYWVDQQRIIDFLLRHTFVHAHFPINLIVVKWIRWPSFRLSWFLINWKGEKGGFVSSFQNLGKHFDF